MSPRTEETVRRAIKRAIRWIRGDRAFNTFRIRAFKASDFLPVAGHHLVGQPHFVGIAAPRSGTTWWYRLLLEHPAVRPNRLRQKELSYFYHFGFTGLSSRAVETYRQAFAAPPGCLCGEWTPGYYGYPLAIDYLAQAAPKTKLLAIVRNPIDRLASALNQQDHLPLPDLGLKGERAALYRRFSVFRVVVEQSLYGQAFSHVLKHFDQSRLLVLQYERCRMDPAGEIRRTYRFLGIEEDFLPPSLHDPVNAHGYSFPPLKPDERRRLADYFRQDLHEFAGLFPEIDLSLWADFTSKEAGDKNGH